MWTWDVNHSLKGKVSLLDLRNVKKIIYIYYMASLCRGATYLAILKKYFGLIYIILLSRIISRQ